LSGNNIGSNLSTQTLHVSRTVMRTDGTVIGLDSFRAGHKQMANFYERGDQPLRHI